MIHNEALSGAKSEFYLTQVTGYLEIFYLYTVHRASFRSIYINKALEL